MKIFKLYKIICLLVRIKSFKCFFPDSNGERIVILGGNVGDNIALFYDQSLKSV